MRGECCKASKAGFGDYLWFQAIGVSKTCYWGWKKIFFFEGNQCSRKSLSRNYLALKFAKWHVCVNHKVAELLNPVYINKFPFICEIRCRYQKWESHDQNDEISNPLNLSETICKEHVQKISDSFGQFANILPWCYLLSTVYDNVS